MILRPVLARGGVIEKRQGDNAMAIHNVRERARPEAGGRK